MSSTCLTPALTFCPISALGWPMMLEIVEHQDKVFDVDFVFTFVPVRFRGGPAAKVKEEVEDRVPESIEYGPTLRCWIPQL